MLIFSSSIHPYIFFNPDHATLTFLGFRVDPDGNLLDPQTEEIVKENLMSKHLRTGLHVQKVDFSTDFESYTKYVFFYMQPFFLAIRQQKLRKPVS